MKDKTEISEGRWVTAEWLEHLDWLRREVWPQETSYDAQDRLPKEESGQWSAQGQREVTPENSLGDSSKTKTKGYDLPWIDFAE